MKHIICGIALLVLLPGCAGKYLIRSYPSDAKVYTRDLRSNEKKLIGQSPIQIQEDSKLGDVFFVVLEKQNYRPKELMVRANEGESLTITAQLDPLSADELAEADKVADQKKDDQKPQGQPEKKDKKKDLEEKVEDLMLRVALLENTMSFYKEAMFSSRFSGNGQAKFDRDRNDQVVDLIFKAQQAIVRSDYAAATKMIDSALDLDEYLARGWLIKGSLAYIQKDYDGARKAWERTLKIDPHDKVAYRYLAQVYKTLGLGTLPPKPAELRYPASIQEIEKSGRMNR